MARLAHLWYTGLFRSTSKPTSQGSRLWPDFSTRVAMSRTFYVRRANEVSGPFAAQQLRHMVAEGTLVNTDHVRVADQDKWYLASAVKGLFPDRFQSSNPTPPQTPVPSADSGGPPTALTEGVFDYEAFDRYRVHRLATRWKRPMLWVGAAVGIAIISLVVVWPLIRSEGRLENTIPTGLGWSLADVERQWGDSRNWYWVIELEKDGWITYTAANREFPKVKYMVTGPPDNLTGLTILSAFHEDGDRGDTIIGFAMPCAMLSTISSWDSETIRKWILEHLTPDGWVNEPDELRRGYEKLWLTTMGTKTGTMLMIGVQIEKEQAWSDWSPSPVEPAPAFVYSNVSAKRGDGGATIIGEIANNSGRSFTMAGFTLSVYDSNKRLVDTAIININTFAAGRTKSFSAYVETLPDDWKFKIDFDNGLPVED